MTFLWGNRN